MTIDKSKIGQGLIYFFSKGVCTVGCSKIIANGRVLRVGQIYSSIRNGLIYDYKLKVCTKAAQADVTSVSHHLQLQFCNVPVFIS